MNDAHDDRGTDRGDDFDPALDALFRREHTHVPDEPFLSATLKAVAADRKRAQLRTRLVQAAAVVAVVILSPRLIDGSVWVSARLDELFATTSALLATPGGIAVGAVVGALAVALGRRLRVW